MHDGFHLFNASWLAHMFDSRLHRSRGVWFDSIFSQRRVPRPTPLFIQVTLYINTLSSVLNACFRMNQHMPNNITITSWLHQNDVATHEGNNCTVFSVMSQWLCHAILRNNCIGIHRVSNWKYFSIGSGNGSTPSHYLNQCWRITMTP